MQKAQESERYGRPVRGNDDRVGDRLIQGAKAVLSYPFALGRAVALLLLLPFLWLPKMITIVVLCAVTHESEDYWNAKLGPWWAILWGTIGAAFWVTLGILIALD
jgi:hypothetical protein